VTDFSTREKEENLGTNIHLYRFKDIFPGSVQDGAKAFCIRSRIIILLNNFNIVTGIKSANILSFSFPKLGGTLQEQMSGLCIELRWHRILHKRWYKPHGVTPSAVTGVSSHN